MTPKGTGAIATIHLVGDTADKTLKGIFKAAGLAPVQFKTGNILLGTIVDADRTIDQVTIGCEGPEIFAIHCHGNPLIVEMIMELLHSRGATLISAEELLTKSLTAEESLSTIAIEARLAQLSTKTIAGARIVANQIDGGLSEQVSQWLKDSQTMSLDEIKTQAEQTLRNSEKAGLLIVGCKAVLAGPPNSGKSTLLNHLAGRRKAVVTDVEGTTRDWVSAECRIGPLYITLIDTAGLDEKLAANADSTIDHVAQERTARILTDADLVLLVLDNTRNVNQITKTLLDRIADRKVLPIINKADLPPRLDPHRLPENLSRTVMISAESGKGIDVLKERLLEITEAAEVDPRTAIAFTPRQKTLLKQLIAAESSQHAAAIISELLNGQLCLDK
ncbi:MAG: 50S ribosome-binding GTPase [Sedimentisphaerales bacterium]|nr:50S ribosome-binding GTPase [Sedimentisphaerales bacterium]